MLQFGSNQSQTPQQSLTYIRSQLEGQLQGLKEEISRLDQRLLSASDTGLTNVYLSNGVVDNAAYRKDNLLRDQARDKLRSIEDDLSKGQRVVQSWVNYLYQQSNIFFPEAIKTVSTHDHKRVGEIFGQKLDGIVQGGWAEIPGNQNKPAIDDVLKNLFNLSVGEAVTTGSKQTAFKQPGNIEPNDYGNQESPDDDVDPREKLIVEQWEKRRKPTTLWDKQQAEFAALKAGK